MRILVTGGAGFIGSHIVEALLAGGHQVIVVDDFSAGRRHNLSDAVDIVPGSVLNSVWAGVTGPVDGVVHAAAQTSVASSVGDPVADATTNVLGTIRTVQAAAKLGARRLVYLSSAAVYQNQGEPPFSEAQPLAPSSPYGVSKLTGEHYVRLLAEQAGMGWLTLRLANVYGPRQSAAGEAGVVARWCGALTLGDPVILEGDGLQSRDFIYVGDVASAVVKALESGASGRALNIGTGRETRIGDLLGCLETVSGKRANLTKAQPRPGDIARSALDSSAARRLLGWAPTMELQQGLALTLDWARGQVLPRRDHL